MKGRLKAYIRVGWWLGLELGLRLDWNSKMMRGEV